MAEPSEEIERWRAWARTTSDQILATAVASDKRGGGAWDALLAQAGVTPLDPAMRAELTDKGPPRASGPPPIEVRRALEAMRASVQQGSVRIEAIADQHGFDVDDAVRRLQLDVETLVEDKLRAYIAAVRPKITTSSIFANAAATRTRHLAPGAGPKVSTEVCDYCGAPRSSSATDRTCAYCGSQR